MRPVLGAGFLLCALGLLLDVEESPSTPPTSPTSCPECSSWHSDPASRFPAITNAALHKVTQQDSSLASGVQAAMQQVGGAIGLSFLVTLGLRLATNQIDSGTQPNVARNPRLRAGAADRRSAADIAAILVFALLEHVAVQSPEELAEASADGLRGVAATAALRRLSWIEFGEAVAALAATVFTSSRMRSKSALRAPRSAEISSRRSSSVCNCRRSEVSAPSYMSTISRHSARRHAEAATAQDQPQPGAVALAVDARPVPSRSGAIRPSAS